MKSINEVALKKLPLFSTVSTDTMERFIKEVKINHLSKRNYIIRDNEMTDFVYIIFSGKISVYKLSETGDKRIFFILNEGSILNDDLVNGFPSTIDCECFEDSIILIYDKKKFFFRNILKTRHRNRFYAMPLRLPIKISSHKSTVLLCIVKTNMRR